MEFEESLRVQALATIGGAFIKSGDIERGNQLLEKLPLTWEKEEGVYDPEPSWSVTIEILCKATNYEKGKEIARSLTECFERAIGMIQIGEAQAKAGDTQGALRTFQEAVRLSGDSEGEGTTSLSDIGLGAASTNNPAAATLIKEHLKRPWLSEYLDRILMSDENEEDELERSVYNPAADLLRVNEGYSYFTDDKVREVAELLAKTLYKKKWFFDRSQSLLEKALSTANKIKHEDRQRIAWDLIMCFFIEKKNWKDALEAAVATESTHSLEFLVECLIYNNEIAWVESVIEAVKSRFKSDEDLYYLASDFYINLALHMVEKENSDQGLNYATLAWNVTAKKAIGQKYFVITSLAEMGYPEEAFAYYQELEA